MSDAETEETAQAARRPEDRFEYELEVFRREADKAVQHLYAYLTMHAVAGDHKPVRQLYKRRTTFLDDGAAGASNLGIHRPGAHILTGCGAQRTRASEDRRKGSRNLFARVARNEEKRNPWAGRE
jgi:hypothetical protein